MTLMRFESLSSSEVWDKGMRHIIAKDRVLAKVVARFGVISRDWSSSDPYEAIVESFIYQQISGSAADSIVRKFRGLYSGRLPSPAQFLKTPAPKVRRAGISPQKYSYIRGLCERLVGGELDLESLRGLPDEEVIAMLDDIKGIGRWTAEMFLMFSLRRVDVFPMDDLGIQKGIKEVYGMKHMPNSEKMLELSEKWKPYRSVAALYLWRSQDQPLPDSK